MCLDIDKISATPKKVAVFHVEKARDFITCVRNVEQTSVQKPGFLLLYSLQMIDVSFFVFFGTLKNCGMRNQLGFDWFLTVSYKLHASISPDTELVNCQTKFSRTNKRYLVIRCLLKQNLISLQLSFFVDQQFTFPWLGLQTFF